MRHLVAYETSASDAALTALTPVPDGTITIVGNDIRVPAGMNQICRAAAMINSATATLRAQLISPSLRAMFPFDISPIVNGLVFGSLPRRINLLDNPLTLVVNEPLDALVQNGANVMNRVLVEFCDGSPKQTSGKMFTIRATYSATLVTATWVNSGALTFAGQLPSGKYQIVGMRSWSANLIAARIFFVGGMWRPGVFSLNTENDNEWPENRYGGLGVWGEFENTNPPTLDLLGITDTAGTVFFDLIKTS